MIDTEHMKTETKAPRGRPLQSWDFIFSPEKFDNEIGVEQFSGEGLPLEEMQHQGYKASIIRQDLIVRAQNIVEVFQFDAKRNQIYEDELQRKLDRNIDGHERQYRKKLVQDLP